MEKYGHERIGTSLKLGIEPIKSGTTGSLSFKTGQPELQGNSRNPGMLFEHRSWQNAVCSEKFAKTPYGLEGRRQVK
jgi:hypothetical protein